MKTYSVIITAGGIGKRMGSDIPKQFLEINNKPVLMHTIERFHSFDPDAEIVLTLPLDWQSYWKELIEKFKFDIPHQIIEGGEERFHSVKNAIRYCSGDFIAIHDGVRPLVNFETLSRCWDLVKVTGAVIPVIPVKESLRKIDETGSVALVRSEYRLVQTPQCFSKEIIFDAYNQSYHSSFTDDASLVEMAGHNIALVDGNEENIKLTNPQDLKLAEIILQQKEL